LLTAQQTKRFIFLTCDRRQYLGVQVGDVGFEHLSVMVVDDSRFVLTMLTMILRALKVGKILAHADASEVIADLKVLSKSTAARALVPDIIICDWVMSPITGDMLLRWLRLSEDSPDRFVPFIMISGAADSDKVRISRNLGVTEFLAKPFSVAAVCDHLIAAIEQPRPFLYTRDYFGPDRRRQRRPWNDVDRRVATADDIEYIYSASTMSKLKPSAKAFIFRLPNRLREKVAGLGRGDPIIIPPDLMQAAEQQLDRMEDDYSDWVRGSIKRLVEAHAKALDANSKGRIEQVIAINRLAHELRGQGSTFGYPLITVFGRSLYECTLNVETAEDSLLEFVKAHIDGISAVIREKIKGTGGELGNELVASLEVARKKLRMSS
jgi:CheY-like chemotaxis protein